MRILVTGGAGFIGSNLCEKLLNDGHEVFCLDNFFTGSKENIIHLMDNQRFKFIQHDIVEPLFIEVEQIYNFASPASPVHYQSDPIKTFKTNIIGIINILDLAETTGARLLQASTSEVYGDPTISPQKETYWGNVNCIGIRSCYDEGKRAAETLIMDYYRQNKADVRIVRIFNTYGPKMSPEDGRVVSNFIVQSLKGENITVYGNGEQTRSFCYISDMIEGLVRMMNQNTFTGPVNLGNPEEYRIIDFAHKIQKLIITSSEIVFKQLPQDDPLQRKPDISIAKEKLGWLPVVGIDEGLEKTIAYFKHKIEV